MMKGVWSECDGGGRGQKKEGGKSAKIGTEGRGGQRGEEFKGRRDETKGLTSVWRERERLRVNE